MDDPTLDSPTSNPFSTRFVRPGAIAYRFDQGQNVDELIRRFSELQWWAQIIGPHGSGKTTLMASLAPRIKRAGRPTCVFSLHDKERRLPNDWALQAANVGARVIIVDGYEQLNAWSRVSLKARCRWRDWGLLVTAHRGAGFPTLFRTTATLNLAEKLVAELLRESTQKISPDTVAECFAASGGNLRETLFLLYDRYEQSEVH